MVSCPKRLILMIWILKHLLRRRALVATVRLLLCDQKVTGLSRGHSLFAKSKRKAAYNK